MGDRPQDDSSAFERLIADLSTTFMDLPAQAIDDHLTDALGRVAEFVGADRGTIGEVGLEDEPFMLTHQWVREGLTPIPMPTTAADLPWFVEQLFRREVVSVSRLDDLPPEASRERAFMERYGPRSGVLLPLIVGGTVIGGISFGTIRRERAWPPEVLDRLRLVAQIVASALARKRAEGSRQIQEARMRFLLESTRVMPWEANAQTRQFAYVGSGAVQVLGYPLERWNEKDFWAEHIHPEDRAAAVTACQEASAREREYQLDYRMVAADGRIVWIHDLVTVVRRNGAPVLLRGFMLDITDRKEMEGELRRALAEVQELKILLEKDNVYLREEVESAHDFVGRSPALRAVLRKLEQVAATDMPVLLLGETGTGKELVAHAIHAQSGRRDRPLVAVNCAALPAGLIESELFGHEKGAFTGATRAQPGRFELAHGSTLLLDEIADLDHILQAKLLRVLQDGEIQRIGSSRRQKVDVRIIAATNHSLAADMREGRFRSDLYYRLAVFPIEVPPLRERREDIPLLVWHFIQSRYPLGRYIKTIPAAAMDALMAYDWPGNVRELRNVVERALILSVGPVLRIEEALGSVAPVPSAAREGTSDALRDADRDHILRVLERCHWTIEGREQAAERLGLKPSTLRNRMKKLGLRRPRRLADGSPLQRKGR